MGNKTKSINGRCFCSICCRRISTSIAYPILAVLFTSLVFLTLRCGNQVTEVIVEIEKPKVNNRLSHMPSFLKDLFGIIELEEEGDAAMDSTLKADNPCDKQQNFNVLYLSEAFSKCATSLNKEKVDIEFYLDAWDELNRFLLSMGKAFSFVSSDVTDKIKILRELVKNDGTGNNYKTIEDMVLYEKSQNLIDYKQAPSKSVKASGSRTLLRLHRSLKFLSLLFDKLAKNADGGKVSTMGYNAYHASPMSKYHPWLVQKAVGVAVYMLPDRPTFIKQMCQNIEVTKLEALMVETAESMDAVFEYTHAMYSKNEILEVP